MDFKLTQYSHGAGCGCKISPAVLQKMLHGNHSETTFPGLLVGNRESDDAAVFDLGDGTALISTTDFFMPIVDDPTDFGRIASVNSISDVYAMGGTPLLAIAILGWPVNILPAEIGGKVLFGARDVCEKAGIPLAGGHSIDSAEPIFGLAVTGRVRIEHLKKNGGACAGDQLYLTKPIGVGILTTAQKQGKLAPEHEGLAVNSMLMLNSIGEKLGKLSGVRAMTDVTGFGLLGHLIEMCEASGTSSEIIFDQVPLIDKNAVMTYLKQGCIPGGTFRNWDSYGNKVAEIPEIMRNVLCDPQTSGGLLIAISPDAEDEFTSILAEEAAIAYPVGRVIPLGEKTILVR